MTDLPKTWGGYSGLAGDGTTNTPVGYSRVYVTSFQENGENVT